jgi:hypothetical protein
MGLMKNFLYLSAIKFMSKPNRIKIDLDHPNTGNAEAFLNSWEEPFLQEKDGTNQFVFRSTDSQTKVALSFFDSWSEANAFGAAHFDAIKDNSMWSVNGSMLFVVSGDDIHKVRSLIGHFAGRE